MALLAIWDEDGAHIHAVPPPVATVAVDVAPEAWRAWKSVVIRGLDGCTVQATGRRIVALGLVSRTMLVDPDTHRVIAELNQGAEHVAFSPRGSYVSTWRPGAFAERRPAAAPGSAARTTTVDFRLSDPKLAGQMQTVRSVFSRGEEVEIVGGATEPDEPSANADADASAPSVATKEDKENLSIWRVSDGALLASFSQRNVPWPPRPALRQQGCSPDGCGVCPCIACTPGRAGVGGRRRSAGRRSGRTTSSSASARSTIPSRSFGMETSDRAAAPSSPWSGSAAPRWPR